jgi:hypothetical protein
MEDKARSEKERSRDAHETTKSAQNRNRNPAINDAGNTTGENAMGSGSEATNSGDTGQWDREFEDED